MQNSTLAAECNEIEMSKKTDDSIKNVDGDMPSPIDPQLKRQLLNFLHTGMEVPKYFPGNWESHNYFEVDKLKSIDNIFATNKNVVEVVEIILKVWKGGLYTRFDTIIFALTKCILLGGPPVKSVAYNAIPEVCKTSEEFLLFAKYSRKLKTGYGRRWCKSVTAWYSKMEPMEIAKAVSAVKARHGRSHKVIVQKSHMKVDPADIARDAVIKYTLFGLKKAQQLIGSKEEAKEIFEYLHNIDDVRRSELLSAVAQTITQYHFTLEHVPSHFLSTHEIWDAVLPQLTLPQILYNLQRMHNMAAFVAESSTLAITLSIMNNKDIIKKSELTPIAVYIAICNYKAKSRPLKYEKAKYALEKEQRRRTRQIFNEETGVWEWINSKLHSKEIKLRGIENPPNQEILASLQRLMEETWLLTPKTGARYMITMDMRHNMFKGYHFYKKYLTPKPSKKVKTTKTPPDTGAGGDTAEAEKKNKKRLLAECFYNSNITPGHAAIVMALHILKREDNVKLAVFSEESIHLVVLERNFSNIEEAEFVFRKADLGKVQLDAPIKWATKKKEHIDVFINMIDKSSRYMELDTKSRGGRGPGGTFVPPPSLDKDIPDRCPVRALHKYRAAVNLPNAKLVVMSLASHRVGTTDGTHDGVLDVVGIDEHVPKLIDAFTKDQFQ